jgi:hypothetical protein
MAREDTRCVNAEDYEPLSYLAEGIVLVASLIAAIFTFGLFLIVSMAAAFAALRKVINYILYGKLVCLGGDRCAIGWIVEIEPVGYKKSFAENMDDDYTLNVLLAPSSLLDFERDAGAFDNKLGDSGDAAAHQRAVVARRTAKVLGHITAHAEVQGDLLGELFGADMPEPRGPADFFGHRHGYYTWFEGPQIGSRFLDDDENQVHVPLTKSLKGQFPVPVLHAECEGSRAKTLLDVLDNFPPGLGFVCEIWLIGPIVCAIVSALLAPLILGLLAIAWAAADAGDPADVGDGTIAVGDLVVLKGRWVWDAGHSGYNELHPLKTLQKIPVPASGADPWSDFKSFDSFREEWCSKVTEAPWSELPGLKPQGMTPEQETIWDNQQQPENDWELHPYVDGSKPPPPPPSPPEPEPEPDPVPVPD